MKLDCNGKYLDLTQPQVMGILNVTPDSFSDGGRFIEREKAIEAALRMQEEGAAIIDIGGESTRPGARSVSEHEELARVLPVIEALSGHIRVPLSIDTSKPGVMRAAVEAGAGLINDVMALRQEGALDVAAELAVPVCLMHMQGIPRNMQHRPHYHNVLEEVVAFLRARVEACVQAGISRTRLLIDPGFGFGKTLEHNVALLRHLSALDTLELPVLVGISRKSMLGALTGRAVDARLAGSLAAAVLAVERGAKIVRVHDVQATVDALKIVQAVMKE